MYFEKQLLLRVFKKHLNLVRISQQIYCSKMQKKLISETARYSIFLQLASKRKRNARGEFRNFLPQYKYGGK